MDVFDIRLKNLHGLLEERKDPNNARSTGVAALARELGKAEPQIQQYATRNRNIGDKFARELEETLGLPNGWMDRDQSIGVREDAGQYLLSLGEEAAAVAKVWADLPLGLRWRLIEQIEDYQRLYRQSPTVAKATWAGPSKRVRDQERKIEVWQAKVHGKHVHGEEG